MYADQKLVQGLLLGIITVAALSSKATVVDLTAAAREAGGDAYLVSASSVQGKQVAKNAFDGDWESVNEHQWRSGANAGLPQTLTYQFADSFNQGAQLRLVSYAIYHKEHGLWSGGTYKHIPKSWTVEASSNGVDWEKIDERADISWSNNAWKIFPALQMKAFRYYRFIFTAVCNTTASEQYVSIPELRMYGEVLDADADLKATRYWIGESEGNWADSANWSEGPNGSSVPADGERVVIGGVKSAVVTVDSTTAALAELQIGGAEYSPTLTCTNWDTCVKADSVLVGAKGTLTCVGGFSTLETRNRVWVSCTDFTVAKGGNVDVSKKGYRAANGPGASSQNNTGASHGGLGAQAGVATYAAPTYGDESCPEEPGSGAHTAWVQSYQQTHGNSGGGAIRVEAKGRVEVAGSILADGESAYAAEKSLAGTQKDNAGSGGSVWIECDTFVGAGGTVSAKGGDGDIAWWPAVFYSTSYTSDERYGQAGGGGRIAIHYDANHQTAEMSSNITISVKGGLSLSTDEKLTSATADKYQKQAEPGTLWFTDKQIVDATLGRSLSGCVVGFSDYTIKAGLHYTAGHVRFQGNGFALAAAGDLTITGNTSRIEVGGVCCTNRTAFAEVWAGTRPISFEVAGNLDIQDGARLDIRAAATNGTEISGALVSVGGSLRIGTGGSLYAWCDPVNLGSPRFIVEHDFIVADGAVVSAEYRGGAGAFAASDYASAEYGPKRTQMKGYGPGRGDSYTGGSHGGRGGRYVLNGEEGSDWAGNAYDDPYRPSLPGTGGNTAGYGDAGSGGGLVSVEAKGDVVVDGEINADGRFAWYRSSTRSSAGSGGTIFLVGKTFSGTGTLSAKGGPGYHSSVNSCAAAGGGGRIAIWTGEPWSATLPKSRIVRQENVPPEDETYSFTGTVTAAGGKGIRSASSVLTDEDVPAAACGGNGTVWFCKVNKPQGLLLLFR